MKKYFSILLIVVFLLNAIGVAVYFPVQKFLIKKEIKKNLPEKALFSITLNSNNKHELNWEDDDEFHYKGDLYDVLKKKENHDGSTTFFCVNDSKENALFVNMDKLIKEKSSKGNLLLKNMMQLQWMHPASKQKNIVDFPLSKNKNNFSYSFSYQFSLAKSVSQPPELA